MTPQLKATLTKALRQLETERANLDRQMEGVKAVLGISGDGNSSRVRTRAVRTRTMSAAAKKRVSQRMKKYWAERRKAATNSRRTTSANQKKL